MKFKIAVTYWFSGWCAVAMIWNIDEGNTIWAILMGISTILNATFPKLFGWWKEVA